MVHSLEPPDERLCQSEYHILCYGPPQLETAYGERSLFDQGIDGKGETIVLVDPFGAPTIRQDLRHFDSAWHLPTPPTFTILRYGRIPHYRRTTTTMFDWALETTLDVEYAHTTAPGADLLLVETATSETVGSAGFATIVAAENYVIDHHLGDVISQSFGTAEQTFTSAATILKLRSAYENAYRQGVTVLAAAGDTGATGTVTADRADFFPYRVVGWPASDPLVTAVGGTQITLSESGRRTKADRVWNTTATDHAPAAGGGGVSTVFRRPSFQDRVASVVSDHRGVPDVSMDAATASAPLIYFSVPGLAGTWAPVGGTSGATPMLAGILALADQVNGGPLGYIDPALYVMAAEPGSGISPVLYGDNSVSFSTPRTHARVSVAGYQAKKGYNLAAGLGTVDAARFVPALVRAVGAKGSSVTYGVCDIPDPLPRMDLLLGCT